VTWPIFLPFTLAALREGTAIVVLPPDWRDPDTGDAANHGWEVAVVNFIAWPPAVMEHETGIP